MATHNEIERRSQPDGFERAVATVGLDDDRARVGDISARDHAFFVDQRLNRWKLNLYPIMIRRTLIAVVVLISGAAAFAQTKSYESPGKTVRALIIPVDAESRVEIRSASGALLRQRNLVSSDHNHGEGVEHAQWTADGRFFVFTTSSSGGHQPWHVPTYFYSIGRNRFYSLDAIVGPIVSDFTLRDDMLLTTRMGLNLDDRKPVSVSLNRWR